MADENTRVALITGAANGMGLATARRLVEAGASVELIDVVDEVHSALADLVDAKERIRTHVADLRDDAAVGSVVDDVVERHGRVDILVNNAAIHPKKDGGKYLVEEIPRDGWDDVLHINLTAPFLLCQRVLPLMKEAGWGRVVNISSAGAFGRPLVATAHYVSTKAAIAGLTRCIAEEAAKFGITANAIAPGPVETALTRQSSPETIARLTENVPVGRYGRPEEIASLVEYLCTDDAAFINGAVLSADGGSTMR